MNVVSLTGRLTKDPELKTTPGGKPWTSFSLAVNRRFKTEGQPDADFISCVAWNKTAEIMAQYLHKGSLIAVQGHIQTRNYENQQGPRVYVTEVAVESFDFLETRASDSQHVQSQVSPEPSNNPAPQTAPQPNYYQRYSRPAQVHMGDFGEYEDLSHDLPF